jgi:hypothetical protein
VLSAGAEDSIENLGATNQTNKFNRLVAIRNMRAAYQALVARISVWLVVGSFLVHDTVLSVNNSASGAAL